MSIETSFLSEEKFVAARATRARYHAARRKAEKVYPKPSREAMREDDSSWKLSFCWSPYRTPSPTASIPMGRGESFSWNNQVDKFMAAWSLPSPCVYLLLRTSF